MKVLIGSFIFGFCLASVGYGQVISVSFAGDNGGGNTVSIGGIESTPEVAGVVPVPNWNSDDFFLDEGFIEDLLDDSGAATSAAVEWAGSANTWGGTGATTEDEMMVNGWLDDNGSGADVLVTGIPYENYDLYVYGSSDAGNAGRGLTTRVNEVDYFSNGIFVDPVSDNGSFYTPEVGYVNAATVSDNPTYFKIGGLSGDELSIFGQRNQVGPEVPNGITDFRGGIAGFQIVDCGDVCEVTAVPPASVAGVGIGSQTVSGSPANQVFGDATEGPGLAQEWFAVANPGDKVALDEVFANNTPAVAAFRAGSGTSWWTGSSTTLEGVPNYPAEVQPQLVDNYSVRLTGEIFIRESGFYRFADGVDDFTFLSIDDEVLIEDNTWTGVLRDANGGGGEIGEVELDVADGGGWLAIEVNVAEGGGGDSGVLYWDYSTEDGVGGGLGFPDFADEAILLEDAVALLVPDSHLRSSVASLISGEIVGTIPASDSGWEFEINAADSTADAFELSNPNADVFTTMLDVDGAAFILSVDGDVSEGDTFQILIADIITGTPSISPEGWNFDATTGSVVFGNALACDPNSQGDLNGDGNVGFPDFLILSANFGAAATSHTDGDINCDGNVGFPDFLILSANFGTAVGAEAVAASVPEPAAFALLSFAGLLGGLVRRRRR